MPQSMTLLLCFDGGFGSLHKFRGVKQLKPHDLPLLIIIDDDAGFDFFAFLDLLI